MVTSSSQLLSTARCRAPSRCSSGTRRRAAPDTKSSCSATWRALNEQMKKLFPGEEIDAQSNGKEIVLSGRVSTKELSSRSRHRRGGLRRQGGRCRQPAQAAGRRPAATRCCCACASRKSAAARSPSSARPVHGPDRLQEHARPLDDAAVRRRPSTLGQGDGFGSDVTSAGKFTFSDFLNLFLFSEKYDIGAVIKALQTKGLFQSLAEPNLVAESGKEASFLAGGEIPGSGGAGHRRQRRDQRPVQGIRRPPELHAGDRRQPRPPEGAARSQHARLRERRRRCRASAFPRSARGARRPSSSSRTARRSRSPVC